LIRSATHTFEQQLYDATLAHLPAETQAALEALLSTEIATLQETRDESQMAEQEVQEATQEIEEPTTSPLQHIRQDPGRIGLATMLEEMAKLRRIRELGLPENLFPGIARHPS
jgi:hypothetical protein